MKSTCWAMWESAERSDIHGGHTYVSGKRDYEDDGSGIVFMDVCEDIEAYFLLNLYHHKEM